MTIKRKFAVWLYVRRMKLQEWVRFDSRVAAFFLFLAYEAQRWMLKARGRHAQALIFAAKIFRHVQSARGREYAVRLLEREIRVRGMRVVADDFFACCNVDRNRVAALREGIISPPRPFDKRLIILSPPDGNKKGVVFVKFTDYFKYLRAVFDVSRLGREYLMVLEPSSSGYFDEGILCLMGHDFPIVVQTPEPVDRQFLDRVGGNLIPVDLGPNCWADGRTFYPTQPTQKRYDVIMVAIWADVKRHYHLFEALSKSRRRDQIKVALVGVPWPKTLEEIRDVARYFSVDHCIEYFERLSQPQVNALLNQSKVFLLLSKKEGFNKAIIEALHADVPGFLLEGHNFGHHYAFINPKTGGWIAPDRLTAFLDQLDTMRLERRFAPHEWASQNMSPEVSTAKIIAFLEAIEAKRGIEINKNLAIKVNNPEYDYADPACWERYADAYKGLGRFLRDATA